MRTVPSWPLPTATTVGTELLSAPDILLVRRRRLVEPAEEEKTVALSAKQTDAIPSRLCRDAPSRRLGAPAGFVQQRQAFTAPPAVSNARARRKAGIARS